MKLFLSYPSAQRALAERLTLALEAEAHDVFIDRSDLKAGEAFHQALREAILGADAMVFLVTPEAVAPGSYALAELNIAQQRWRRPGQHVLPVMVVPTPITTLPAYLSAVTILQPHGDTVAETVAAVARLAGKPVWHGKRLAAAVALALVAAAAVGVVLSRQAEQRAAELARLDAQVAAKAAAQRRALGRANTARELCESGGYAVALAQLNELVAPAAARNPAQDKVLDMREDCAMRWLRDMRATVGKLTFGEQVAVAQPILLQGVERASGMRAADLRAHIGWGEYLRGRDGAATVNPLTHWKRALVDDPSNVYAHAMWARVLLERPGRINEARSLFDKALASERNRTFVRGLQFGAALGGSGELVPYALQVADEMRRNKEVLITLHRDRLWSGVFSTRLLDSSTRTATLTALPPADALATYRWLFPLADMAEDRKTLWRFNLAALQAYAGDTVAARKGFEALVVDMNASGGRGRMLDESQRGLARLSAPAGDVKLAK